MAEKLTQQEHNMKLRELAMSYLPGTEQFDKTYKEDYTKDNDDEFDEGQVLNDIVLGVDDEHAKIVWLTVGGPTTYLKFIFEGTKCNFETFKRAELHSNAVEYETNLGEDVYEYSTPDAENLYHEYESYISDWDFD